MKAEHLGALDQLRATHALEHSSSKVAELANKLKTQEVLAHITFQPVQCQQGMLTMTTLSLISFLVDNSDTFARAAEGAAGNQRCTGNIQDPRGRAAEAGGTSLLIVTQETHSSVSIPWKA